MKTDVVSAYDLQTGKKLGAALPHFCGVRLITLAHEPVRLYAVRVSDGERVPLGLLSERRSQFRLLGFSGIELECRTDFSAMMSVIAYQEEEPRSDEVFVEVPLTEISPLLRMREQQRRNLRYALGMQDDDVPGPGYEIDDEDDPELQEPDWFEPQRARPEGSSERETAPAEAETKPETSGENGVP